MQNIYAQWSAIGGGSCDMVYAISPDVSNTGIYFGMNYGNCPTYPSTKNYIQYTNGSATPSNLNANAYVNGYIYAIAVSGTKVYVGGDFTKAGGTAGYNGIACWNTSTNTWSTLGTGVGGSNATVYSLAVDATNNILYAGGEFTTANGTTVNNVAAYNLGTSAWSAMSGGVTGLPGGSASGTSVGVYALTVCGSNLFVGGRYTTAGGSTANNIASWSGASWSTLTAGGQTGVTNVTVVGPNVACAVWDAAVMALTNDGTNVYVGGDFDKAGGSTGYSNIGCWNTGSSTWSKLGTGMHFPLGSPSGNLYGDNANVWALTMYNGNVIAGGDFEGAGGTVGGSGVSLFVAQWNGSTWSGLSSSCGGSTDSDVFSLGVSNGVLYAGGQFDSPAYYIAKYTGAGPSITLSVPPSDTICNGSSISVTASGSATSYSWSPGGSLSCTTCANPTATPSTTTTYTVTGTTSGCSSTKTVTVVVNPKPTLTLTPTSSSLCGTSATTTITAAGASTYTWSNAATLSASTGTVVTATPTTTTIYTVNATDSKGCTNNKTVTITVHALPTLTLSAASPSVCIGSGAAITASGASTYTWSPAGSLSSSTGSSVTATPTTATSYTVTGTDVNNCTNTQTVTVNVNPLPTLSLTASSSTLCTGSTSTLTASGASTYTWSPAGSLSSSTGSSVTATPTTATSYTVIGTDANGCKNNQAISININPPPSLTITPSSVTVCTGASTTLTATGADTYAWSPSGSLNNSTGSTVVASPTISTTYTVVGTNTLTGCTNTVSVNITITPTPTISIVPSSSFTICLYDSTSIQVTGGGSYTWTPSGSLSSSTSATVTASPTTTTVYTVTSVAGGCASTAATATVTVNLPPDISAHAFPNHVCTGGTSTLSVSGSAVSYTWSPAGSLSSPTGSPVTATPSATTVYTVVATGVNGCTATDTVRVRVNPSPTVSISSGGGGNSQSVCSGATVNGITFNPSAGAVTTWTNTNVNIGIAAADTTNIIPSYTAPTVTVSQTGTITAVAIDTTTGCRSDTVTPPVYVVTINPLPVIDPTMTLTPGGCGGLANGCIDGVSGQAPGTYQYSWDNGATWSNNSQNCNIPAGNYTVEVQDQNGCISSETISLPTANAPALPSVTGLPGSACVGDTVTLVISPPAPGMTYTWTSSSGTVADTIYAVNGINPSGTYNIGLTIADSNNCSNSTNYTITVNTPPQPVISGINHFCNGTSTVLNASPVSGNDNYQWNNAGVAISGANTSTYTATTGGTYGVVITNTVTGCSGDTTFVVTVDSIPSTPVLTAGAGANNYCEGQTLDTLKASGPSTIVWYDDAGLTHTIDTGMSYLPTNIAPGTTVTYYLVDSSAAGCKSTGTATVSVTVNANPSTPTVLSPLNNSYCEGQTLDTLKASGPSTIVWYDDAGLTHTIDTGMSYLPTNIAPGTTVTYYLVDSSAAGCKSTGTVTVSVTVNPTPSTPVLASPSVNNYCEGQTLDTLKASGPSTIVWYDDAGLTHTIDTGMSYLPTNIAPGTTVTYYLVDSSAAGCKSTGTVTVSVTVNANPSTPSITSTGNNTYCDGQTIGAITASGTGTIVWYDDSGLTHVVNSGTTYTPSNITPGSTVTYYLVDTSSAGCKSATDSVSVTVYPTPVVSGGSADSALCGASNGSINGIHVNGGTPSYSFQWYNGSTPISGGDSSLTNVGIGTYSVVITDANGCVATGGTTTYTVPGDSAVHADFTPSTTTGLVPLDVLFTNNSTGANGYIWDFGTVGATSNQQNPSYTYTAAGTYTVVLLATHGSCSDTAVRIITTDSPTSIVVPNIYSPNGDGINDDFFIICSGISNLHCDIYNRWGQLVYQLLAPNQKWDGVMNNGNKATDGTYYYILEAQGEDGKTYKSDGTVTLVR